MSSNFKTKVAKSAFWMTLSNWIVSSLGIISTLILARILTPDDFGLIATATIVTGFFDLFARLGTMQYIINKDSPDKSDINTAWTIQFLSQLIIATLIVLSASVAATYFNAPKLEAVLLVLAIIPLLIGTKNVGIVLLQKKMEFKRIMVMQSTSKTVSFIVLLSIAYAYQTYWAFIIAMVVHHATALLLSYMIASYRPHFCLLKIREQFSFSSWILLKGFVNYAGSKADAFLISKYLSIANIGFFNLGTRIATIPNDYLLKPLDNVIYSGLAESLNTKELFYERCQKTLSFILFITIPISAIVILSAAEIVAIFLGDTKKWSTVAQILPYLSLQIVLIPVWSRLYDFVTLIGQVKRVFLLDCGYAVLSISALSSAIIYDAGLVEIIIVSLSVKALFMSYLLYTCRKLVHLNIVRLFYFIAPIIFSTFIACLLTLQITSWIQQVNNSFIQLILTSSVFMILHLLITLGIMLTLIKSNSDYQTLIEFIRTCIKKKKRPKALF